MNSQLFFIVPSSGADPLISQPDIHLVFEIPSTLAKEGPLPKRHAAIFPTLRSADLDRSDRLKCRSESAEPHKNLLLEGNANVKPHAHASA